MKKIYALAISITLIASLSFADESIKQAVARDYDSHLSDLFVHFHQNPELSNLEHKTAARIAWELRAEGFDVTTGVGGTGIVAILKNGSGPMVMMRADMDGLPVLEKSGLSYASKVSQLSPITKRIVPVAHSCGHDVHITSLVGAGRAMAAMKDKWSGTLMLIGQPAEEVGPGAEGMMADGLWQRFGIPDYALALHVTSEVEAGVINAMEGSPFAGVDRVDIIIHGLGSHGAFPHESKDPIVLGSQIVLALQTLVSRELSPRQPGVVTVGSFHSGTKHNIISDRAHLQLTVRNTNAATSKLLLDGIKRIAENMGRVAGLPEDLLPEVIVSPGGTLPPTTNDAALVRRLKKVWGAAMGEDAVIDRPPSGMWTEDFPFFTMDPKIPSVYFNVGGTPKGELDRAKNGGPAVPFNHSPLFKISPAPAIKRGVEAMVLAMLDLMPRN